MFRCALVFCILAALPASAQAPAPPAKGKIAALAFTGTKRYPHADLVTVCGLHIGDVVGREELQAAADRLAAFGVFSSTRYRFASKGDDMSVEFLLEEAPTVPVSFDNFPWFTDDELITGIKKTVVLFDGTAPGQGAILDEMSQVLVQLLDTRGVHGLVEHTLLASPEGPMMQQFKVAGAALTVGSIQFGDVFATESKRVQDRLSDLIGKPYSRFAIELFLNEHVRPLYYQLGRLRVKFYTPQPKFTGNPNQPLPSSVLVIIPIEPGEVYRWESVTWIGNGAFGPAPLNEMVGFRAGDLADGMKIAAAWQRVEKEYRRRGFLDLKCEPVPVFDDAKKSVSYRVTLTEGMQYRMGELVLTGLSPAAEKKVVEAWHIARGQLFDGIYFDEFFAQIKEVFGDLPVHFDEVGHWLRTNPAEHVVDVLLDFH